MVVTRNIRRLVIVLAAITLSAVLGVGTAAADELGDYRWERRPLLVFAPTDRDPRLVETLSRIDASRCEFDGRDMVLGVVVAAGPSTLDGQRISAEQSQQLRDRFAVQGNTFSVLLIGKDGGEKRRVDDVPDLQQIYALIDGMPMRGREVNVPC